MGGFLIKLLIALTLTMGLHICAAYFADGVTDAYYLRFTGKPVKALILGNSRAAQGLSPNALNALLPVDLQADGFFNFSFTIGHSPYGKSYASAIFKKLDPATRDGVFLMAMDPWSLSIDNTGRSPDATDLPEEGRFLGRMWTVNMTPNLEYLARYYPNGWGSLMGGPLHEERSEVELLANGWLVTHVAMDSATVAVRTKRNLKAYADHANGGYVIAPVRMEHLAQLVDRLKAHGTVVMVRMPVHPEMLRLELGYWPGFSRTMDAFARDHDVKFIDHAPLGRDLVFKDGNHLTVGSASTYSQALADSIIALDPHWKR